MNLEDHMKAITDAARYVRARLPRGHGLELADLVSVGAEHVLRYLSGSDTASHVLVFISARQAMVMAARRWSGRCIHGTKRKTFADPVFCGFDEARDVGHWDQWLRYTLPLEEMIDTKRALLAMQLREAVAWYSHHWLCEELTHLEAELGVSHGRIRQYCAAARAKLAAAWQGERFDTEDEIRERRRLELVARDERRAVANARMLAERKARYAELKRLGADHKLAQWGGVAKSRYLVTVRQLTAEAAE